ncbi:hypothetical protein QCD60_02790 [Pokkaliibacter sp. MBI-7]|uniref:hypothetical protein n=1 Tax=Pokkaliibacter sp. MBI-7 TaxID=3040600 RepID=UPI00244D4D5B|nr:hypothetical protein [Pokkaliibacter sp. MBI-7]MDH2431485.1 hypothetical protein [Pokkaliibacter sp. MBI-7]
MKKTLLACAIASVTLSQWASAAVEVKDIRFSPAANMLAYTEFELSGEPLAESLGIDLDTLDPNQVNQPHAFDYKAGIESYEYSEEAMYALNYQSQMGIHLANGPLNKARGGTMQDFGKRVIEMAGAVGFAPEEIPLNMYPLSLPYASGVPELGENIDTATVNSDELDGTTAKGNAMKGSIQTPAYYRDYKTLDWKADSFDKALEPAAIGGIFLKEVMWSQDFLGGMHVAESDEEVEATSATMDQDGKHKLGVSSADGMNGMFLTEESIDKLLTMQQSLGFDGKQLGARITPQYDPAKGIIYFPHKVKVTQGEDNGVNSIAGLSVEDSASTLRDTWMMLWPLSEFYAYSDQRKANEGQNPAFLAVFDGAPFAAAPAANTDADVSNDVAGSDAFSLASNLSNLEFKNLQALHFNSKAGTFVDRFSEGKQGQHVSTYDAAYTLVALQIFQRAHDALPVGYASGDAATGIDTPEGKQALELIRKQADFILSKLVGKDGLVADGLALDGKVDAGKSVDAQFAAVRGLTAAFLATKDEKYRDAARKLFAAADKAYFNNKAGSWIRGDKDEYTPWTQAAISGGLRSAIQNLRNRGDEKEPALELQQLTERYVSWFGNTVNGGMQLAEWLGDSGENVLATGNTGDTDEDGVKQITAVHRAQVLAGKADVTAQ